LSGGRCGGGQDDRAGAPGRKPGQDPLLPAADHQAHGQPQHSGAPGPGEAGRLGRRRGRPEAMKIDAARDGGSALVQLEGRLDREWAEHLSHTLEDLLHDGVRSLNLDFSGVTYVSSAATKVLSRWHQELAVLRGEVQLTSVSPAVREAFAVAGWD